MLFFKSESRKKAEMYEKLAELLESKISTMDSKILSVKNYVDDVNATLKKEEDSAKGYLITTLEDSNERWHTNGKMIIDSMEIAKQSLAGQKNMVSALAGMWQKIADAEEAANG